MDAADAAEPDRETLIPSLGGVHYAATLGRDTIAAHIERDFAAEVAKTATISKLSPTLGGGVRTLLEGSRAQSLGRLEKVFANHSAAETAMQALSAAEDDALMALLAHRCATMEEAAIKFQYLHDSPIADELQPDQIEALLGSFLPIGAAT